METPIQYAVRTTVEEHFRREHRRQTMRGVLVIAALAGVGLALLGASIIVVPS